MTLLYGDVGAAALDDEPAIRAVDDVFASAIRTGASDVHIEPWAEGGRVRERVDGLLRESRLVSARLLPRVLSRIKLLAGMDIADRRMPQDGRYAVERPDGTIDARVSSIPTIEGEKLAIRLLDARASVPNLEALGMPPGMAAKFRQAAHAAAGLVVICGPTGSGKTTTLYAALSERNVTGQHVCSIEDRVEVRLRGMQDDQTIVLGGLMRDTSNETISRVPGLADIPIIGKLFQNKQTAHERDEIVFLITPHVMYPEAASRGNVR